MFPELYPFCFLKEINFSRRKLFFQSNRKPGPYYILAIKASFMWLSTTFPPPNNMPITSKRVSPL